MSLPVDVIVRKGGKVYNYRRENDLNLSFNVGEHGPDRLNFELCNWGNKLPDLDSTITMRDPTYGIFFSGYLGQPKIGGFFGGASTLEGRGWYHSLQDDGWDERKVWAAGTPLINLVMEAISKAGTIFGGIPFPRGLTTTQLPEDSPDFASQTPEDVFNFVKQQFAYLQTPLIWQIRQNPEWPFSEEPCLETRFVDPTPRYRIRITKNDKFEPTFDTDTIFNQASVAYGNGLFATAQAVEPYTVIQRLRKKRVNANVDVYGTFIANLITEALVARNNQLRPINTSMEIHCDTKVEALYPAVPIQTSNVPHWFIRPHYFIRVLNDMTAWGQYKVRDYYIVDVKHTFDGNTVLTLGDPVFYDAFKLLQSYITNRAQIAIESGVVNEPLRDADSIPVYGPTSDGSTPPTLGQGIDIHYLDKLGLLNLPTDPSKPYLPYGAGVHPHLNVDYGVQLNFGREASSIGGKGYIRVIPCVLQDWALDFTPPPGSDTVPTDSIQVQLYPTYPYTVGANIIATLIVNAAQGGTGTITPSPASLARFAQGGKVGVRVSSAAATTNCGFQIGLGGRKLFPDVGVTS